MINRATLIPMLERHEGKRFSPYKCSQGFWTIGIGFNFDANPLPQHIKEYLDEHGEITNEMVLELLESSIQQALAGCYKLYPEFDSFSENRSNALVDFVFNVGLETARTFIRTNKAINSGEWKFAAENMRQSLWFKQVKSRGVEITDMIEEG